MLDGSYIRSWTLLSSLVMVSAPVVAAVPSVDGWVEARSPHYRVATDGRPELAVETASRLEKLRRFLSELRPGEDPVAAPTQVLIFDGRENLAKVIPGVTRSPHQVGQFVRGSYGNFIAVGTDAGAATAEAVNHELVHSFIAETLPDLPLWFSEGVAEYYSTFEVSGMDIRIGVPVARHIEQLLASPRIDVDDLLATTARDPDDDVLERESFYADAWLLVHYLMHGDPGWPEKIGQLLAALRTMPPSQALEESLGLSLGDLNLGLHRYLHQAQFVALTASVPELEEEPVVEWGELQPEEVAVRLGLHLAELAPADAAAEAAAEGWLGSWDAVYGEAERAASLAHLRHRQGRWDEARVLFERSMYLDSQSHESYVQFGHFLIESLGRQEVVAGLGEVPGDAVRAGLVLERAIEIAPQFAEPRALLGYTYLYREPSLLPRGIALLNESVRVMPGRQDLLFDLAMLHVRAGNLEQAADEASTLERAGADDLARAAREAIQRAETAAMSASGAVDDRGR